MTDAFIRVYIPTRKEKEFLRDDSHNTDIVLVFDTETTIDEYQNLLFGSCVVKYKGEEQWFLFYSEDLAEKDVETIRRYGRKHGLKVLSRSEFVENVFYKYGYYSAAEIVGFNLPFDLSRLAVGYTVSGQSFVFKLIEDMPPIRITHVDQRRAFIEFVDGYRGYFVDLKTLCFALTNQSYSLDGACRDFGVDGVKAKAKHGKITPKYIAYNLNDTRITAELYAKALERYRRLGLTESPSRLYSPASIGKNYLRLMGVKPFLEQNPDFDPSILGYAMAAYYGGRVECRIVRQDVKVSYLDFTSMYPTVYCLLRLDDFLKAEKIEHFENTYKVKAFVENVTLEQLADKSTWAMDEMHAIVQVLPQEDILPLRAEYGQSQEKARNIALNYVSSNIPMWYSVLDVIASKLLTGKTPKILRAITFKAMGRQSLNAISIMGVEISPRQDFFKEIIDKRLDVKAEMKGYPKGSNGYSERDQLQLVLKIIANSCAYGIFIEETSRRLEDKIVVDVYSDRHFRAETDKKEVLGEYFNPIMATLITSAARLILAMAEAYVSKLGGYIAYMDTDSIFVSPMHVDDLKRFFSGLNPYTHKIDMFKLEECEDGEPLSDVWFYGVSAKRYCLYRDGFRIVKYSMHGLGHYLGVDGKALDGRKFWRALLDGKYWFGRVLKSALAVSRLTVTKPTILSRFRVLNEGRPYHRQIKPFNFFLVGPEYEGIIPILPYTADTSSIDREGFVDYRSGKPYTQLKAEGKDYYWATLWDVLMDYIMHSDHKYDYPQHGVFQRKHVEIGGVKYVGKETSPLIEESEVLGLEVLDLAEYSDKSEFFIWVLGLSHRQALELGVSDRTLRKIKAKIKSGQVKHGGRALRRLWAAYFRA